MRLRIPHQGEVHPHKSSLCLLSLTKSSSRAAPCGRSCWPGARLVLSVVFLPQPQHLNITLHQPEAMDLQQLNSPSDSTQEPYTRAVIPYRLWTDKNISHSVIYYGIPFKSSLFWPPCFDYTRRLLAHFQNEAQTQAVFSHASCSALFKKPCDTVVG